MRLLYVWPQFTSSFWILRILCWSPLRYCRAGQKSKKSSLGHGLGMIIDQDILGPSLVILLRCFSCVKWSGFWDTYGKFCVTSFVILFHVTSFLSVWLCWGRTESKKSTASNFPAAFTSLETNTMPLPPSPLHQLTWSSPPDPEMPSSPPSLPDASVFAV